jgi:hypothetical protein
MYNDVIKGAETYRIYPEYLSIKPPHIHDTETIRTGMDDEVRMAGPKSTQRR